MSDDDAEVGRPRLVFIAHARADLDVADHVERLGDDLPGWSVIRVPVSDDWWPEAERCIQQCDVFVFVDTLAARRSQNCLRELAAAEDAHRPVLLVSPAELPGLSLERLRRSAGPTPRSRSLPSEP